VLWPLPSPERKLKNLEVLSEETHNFGAPPPVTIIGEELIQYTQVGNLNLLGPAYLDGTDLACSLKTELFSL